MNSAVQNTQVNIELSYCCEKNNFVTNITFADAYSDKKINYCLISLPIKLWFAEAFQPIKMQLLRY